MARTRRDVHGNPVVGAASAVEAYDRAADAFVRFAPEVVPAMTSLVREHPDFAMGHVLPGFVALTSTDAPDVGRARRAVEQIETIDLDGDERALAHRDALAAWADGDWRGAARRLDDLLVRWPADLLALQVGHGLDFYLGDAANLRDRVGRSLHAFDPADPHQAFVRGMYAFGLEESGHYEQARSHGLAALDRNPDDVWALHAVVHTYEMQGLVDAGLRFLREREDDWGDGNLFVVPVVLHTSPSTSSKRGCPRPRWPPMTATSTTRRPPACRSRWSTPMPCCGGCCSTGPTPAGASRGWPTPGRPAPPASPGTSSTTCMR